MGSIHDLTPTAPSAQEAYRLYKEATTSIKFEEASGVLELREGG